MSFKNLAVLEGKNGYSEKPISKQNSGKKSKIFGF